MMVKMKAARTKKKFIGSWVHEFMGSLVHGAEGGGTRPSTKMMTNNQYLMITMMVEMKAVRTKKI